MSIIEKLKAESLRLRKERNPVASSITFALSEIEKFGKNNGNRQTTNDEAIKVIQKLISNIDINLNLNIDTGRKISLNYEKNILSSVLPAMVSDDEIKEKLTTHFKNSEPQNKGEIMKWAKMEWGSRADMKRVSEIIKEFYNI
jgi:uncharacterized protein YqeY